jgi:hypothetical protein
MTHPDHLRMKARQLRRERRLSLDEIVERLQLPRTTVFLWIRDIPLGREPNRSVAAERAAEANRERYRLQREAAYAQGAAEYAALAARPTFVDFVVLYIAEGSKRERNTVAICNSDALVMGLAVRWLRSLTDARVHFSIQYHADQDLDQLRQFWGQRLSFDPDDLALQRKSNSGQLTGRSWRSVHGVITARVYDTALRARLQAWIDLTKATWK